MQSGEADADGSYEGMSSWTVISDNLKTMENLAQSCQSGRICCSRVIVAYKICQVKVMLQEFYSEVRVGVRVRVRVEVKVRYLLMIQILLFRLWFLVLIRSFVLIQLSFSVNYLSQHWTSVTNWLLSISRLLIWIPQW